MNFKNLQRNFLYNARPRKLKKKGGIQKNGVVILSDEFSCLRFLYDEPCVSRSYFRSFVNH